MGLSKTRIKPNSPKPPNSPLAKNPKSPSSKQTSLPNNLPHRRNL
ncbi:hypothetical protein [Rubritalea tangerina]